MADARFITAENALVEQLGWGSFDWLSRPDLTAAEQLLLVRVHIPPGQGHAFHRHLQCALRLQTALLLRGWQHGGKMLRISPAPETICLTPFQSPWYPHARYLKFSG